MKALTELVKSKGSEFIVVTILFGGLLYAAVTAYQTSVTNSQLKEDLNDQKELLEKNLADYKQTTTAALSKQSAAVTDIKKALFVVMAQLNVPTDELKKLIGANHTQLKQILADVIDENPKAHWALHALARASFEAGEYKEASAYFEEALAHIGQMAGDDRRHLAMSLTSLAHSYENDEEAMAHFQALLAMRESVVSKADAYCFLGKQYLSMGNKEDALTYLRKALEIDPDHTDATETLKRLESGE